MITLAPIFTDHLILQREKPIVIYGFSDSAQEITIYLDDREIGRAKANAGAFAVECTPLPATCDKCLLVKGSDGDMVCLTHVDIGDVWVASGQSNMEFLVKYDAEREHLIHAQDRHIRYYEVEKYAFPGEKEEKLNENAFWGKWHPLSEGAVDKMSAVAVWFAKEIKETLAVPVGIIGCSWGGTSASAWLPEAVMRRDPLLCRFTQRYDKDLRGIDPSAYIKKDRKRRIHQMRRAGGMIPGIPSQEEMMSEEALTPPNWFIYHVGSLVQKLTRLGPHDEHRPGGLYTMMQQKIKDFPVKGILWYQGESDASNSDIYGHMLKELIRCWREDWKEKLPFYYVQLAPFEKWMNWSGKNYPMLRQEQQSVEDYENMVYMVSIMDCGSRYDIHPKKKRIPGQRLAKLALQKTYGIGSGAEAPQITKVRRDGHRIELFFDHAGEGLWEDVFVKNRTPLEELVIVRQKGRTLPVTCCLEGNSIIVACPSLSERYPAEISFAYKSYCHVAIYNHTGICARPMAPVEI